MLRSALRLAARLRARGRACTGATAGHPEAWDPFWESWGRGAWLPETPGARSRAFCEASEVRLMLTRWLRSSLAGRHQCQHGSQVACNRAGRRRTARSFGRRGVWRRWGSPRPPPAASCTLQERVVGAAQVAEVRLPSPSALCRARALLSPSAECLTDHKGSEGLHQVCCWCCCFCCCAHWPEPAAVPGTAGASLSTPTGASRQRC